jgi:hypothetical protein
MQAETAHYATNSPLPGVLVAGEKQLYNLRVSTFRT